MESDVHKYLMALLLCAALHPAWANEGAAKEGDSAGPQYLPLDAVIVNLEGRRHYLRANIQLLVDSAEHAEKIKIHTPAIRDALILLFSGRNPVEISTMEAREKLRESAREEIKKVLEHYKAQKGFEDIYFTDFMVQ
jgi:flagellar FliL protein